MLQICYGGQWEAVCDYRWSRGHSVVACKALGYSNPSKTKKVLVITEFVKRLCSIFSI